MLRAAFSKDASRGSGPALTWLVMLLLLSGLVQLTNPGVSDVSWLIVVGERLLDGEHLYKDILEVNPPASLMIYMPAVGFARFLSVRAEYVVLGMMLVLSALTIIGAGRILDSVGLLPHPTNAVIAATLAFVTLPGNSFAQREHIGVVLMLPILALIARRTARSDVVVFRTALAVGIAAGLAVSIKPHFAAAILIPQLYSAWRTSSIRPFFHTENWTILAVGVSYLLVTLVWYPEFWFTVMPLISETYRLARVPFFTIFLIVLPFLLVVSIYCYTARINMRDPMNAVPLLASLGFLLGYFEQSKGWQYHYLPSVALMLYVVLQHALNNPLQLRSLNAPQTTFAPIRAASAVILLVLSAQHFAPQFQGSYQVESIVRALSPCPRVMALTGDLGFGHPFTRRVNGSWVGTVPSQWLTEASQSLLKQNSLDPAKRARLENWVKMDQLLAARDIRRGAPDVILIDLSPTSGFEGASHPQNWKMWAMENSDLKSLLAGYLSVATTTQVELFVRKSIIRNAGNMSSEILPYECNVPAVR